MTDAVVLAAGLGRRLSAVTSLPKWLVPVNDSCPADAQLAAFEIAGVDRVHVVVTPAEPAIPRHVAAWYRSPSIELVANDHAADRNNWFSLLLGLRAVRATGSSDVIVVNSDLFAGIGWFSAVVMSLRQHGEPAALAVDPSRGRTDEAMKVQLDRDGRTITAIGKEGMQHPGGEYVGIGWLSPVAVDGLAATLEGFVEDPDRSDHWYEHAIQEQLSCGARYAAVAVPSSRWVEIDDEHDLAAAQSMPSDEGRLA